MNTRFDSFFEKVKKLKEKVIQLEDKIDRKLDEIVTMNKSILEEIGHNKVLINAMVKEKVSDFITVEDFSKKYNVIIPFSVKKDFENFDNLLNINEELQSDFKNLIENLIIAKDNLKVNIK